MPSHKTLTVFAVGALLTAGLIAYRLPDQNSHQHRHENHHHTAKLSAPVNVRFNLLTSNPEPNLPIELVATIENLGPSTVYSYRFHLPEDTTVLKGYEQGEIELLENEKLQVHLAFQQTSIFDQKIHLELSPPGSEQVSMFTTSTLDFHKQQVKQEDLMKRQEDY